METLQTRFGEIFILISFIEMHVKNFVAIEPIRFKYVVIYMFFFPEISSLNLNLFSVLYIKIS